jgi:hypothetical protein
MALSVLIAVGGWVPLMIVVKGFPADDNPIGLGLLGVLGTMVGIALFFVSLIEWLGDRNRRASSGEH